MKLGASQAYGLEDVVHAVLRTVELRDGSDPIKARWKCEWGRGWVWSPRVFEGGLEAVTCSECQDKVGVVPEGVKKAGSARSKKDGTGGAVEPVARGVAKLRKG